MATLLNREFVNSLGKLRYEPTPKRVRARAGGHLFVDTRDAVLVWEPRRIVPAYAIPDQDIDAELVPAVSGEGQENPVTMSAGGPPVLDPRTGFAAHTCAGQPLSLHAGDTQLVGAGFRPADQDLNGYVVLDFAAFDEWLEEAEPIVGHPRDPFKRIDVRRSTSRIGIEVDGVTLADTTAAHLLFETYLPVRYYIPRTDVRMELLNPSPTRTTCAYKGHAAHWSVAVNGTVLTDLAWTYDEPLSDAIEVAGHIAFYNERVDVIVDGDRLSRPVTPWS